MGTTGLTLTAGDWTYNTDTHVLALDGNVRSPPTSMVIDAADGPLDIIFVSSFTLEPGATLRPTSPTLHRGFGIASTGPILIAGIIDSSDAGAGARVDTDCGMSAGNPGQDLAAGAGGGGGGAFKGKGGNGSKGNSDGTNSTGGTGGTAIAARPKSPIGGCDGGAGGDGSGTGGAPGDGGGAVYLASGTSITIVASGIIDAGGGFGARGGNNGDGGGGGGSGGMILIESKSITIGGIVVANGGGGGEGNTNGVDGEAGTRTTLPAKGGADGDANGGNGGNGGAELENDGASTTDLESGGGGGGGGATGFVAIGGSVPTIAAGAIISPAFGAWP
jgi:hypothetical protein